MTEPSESPVRSVFVDLHLAAIFLTRLPLPDLRAPDLGAVAPGGLARAMRVFPVVGAGIGLAGGLVFWAAGLWLAPSLAALLAVLVAIGLTGALHEDGLADCADALGARGGRERRLEVMRDSRSGAFGVLALIFTVALRAGALAQAPDGWAGLGALVAAAALSRALLPAVMQILPPARTDGLGAGAGSPDISIAAIAAGLGLAIAFIGLGAAAGPACLVAVALVLGLAQWARSSLGGYTGDVLGAAQQVAEIAILLVAAGAWR